MKQRHIALILSLCLLGGCRESESIRQKIAPGSREISDDNPGLVFEGPYWPFSSDRSSNYRFRFKNGEGIEGVKMKEAGVSGNPVYYGVKVKDESKKASIIASALPGLGVYRITDKGVETAECFWAKDLPGVREADFQLFLRLPLSKGDVTELSASEGERHWTVSVIEFEDVSVVAGVFSNCAKIQINCDWVEGKSYVSTFWLAEGVGVVKWIRGTGRVEELVSFQTPFK